MARLLSVNVSLPKEIEHNGKLVSTGIFKEPVKGKVRANKLNLEGDGQADLIGHGGEMRAVYVYSHNNYHYWQQELKRDDFSIGQFGENFTVEGMLDQDIHIGDHFRIGTALFEVSQPRVPCFKLAIKMGEEGFYSRILKSGRLGFYFRVLEEGEVEAGDEIELVKSHPDQLNITQVNDLMYFDKDNYEGFRKALKIEALSPGWKSTFEDRLAKEHRDLDSKKNFRTFIVNDKIIESETITSFHLAPEDGSTLDTFLPGQFLPIKLDIPGQYQTIFRTYSISNAPGADFYRLSIKRELAPPNIPNAYPGVSSNYFHDQVEVGTKILCNTPRGKFYLNKEGKRPAVLLSAGVGLTPMVSMLETLITHDVERTVWFIHGARNGKEHAMGSHIRRIANEHPQVNAHVSYSKPSEDDVQGENYDSTGRVNLKLIENLVGSKECEFYICGPAPFMKSLFEALTNWGVSPNDIYYEFFGPAAEMGPLKKVAQPRRQSEISECCDDVEVNFTKSDIKVNWNPSCESILELAEAHGLNPDFSCRSGICQTCSCSLKSGKVTYVQEPLQDPDAGTVLICCAKPSTDLEIEL